MEKKRWR